MRARVRAFPAALLYNAQFTPPTTRRDKTVLSVSCLLCRCELDDCPERVQTFNFPSATVLSCRESNSQSRSGRDTDKTVLSCLAWRCELALRARSQSAMEAGSWCMQTSRAPAARLSAVDGYCALCPSERQTCDRRVIMSLSL